MSSSSIHTSMEVHRSSSSSGSDSGTGSGSSSGSSLFSIPINNQCSSSSSSLFSIPINNQCSSSSLLSIPINNQCSSSSPIHDQLLPSSEASNSPSDAPTHDQLLPSSEASNSPSNAPAYDSDMESLNPSERPDGGATHSDTIELLANFFKVQCSPEATILQYDIDINPEKLPKDRELRRSIFGEIVKKVGERVALAYHDGANLIFAGRGDDGREAIPPDIIVTDAEPGIMEEYCEFRISNRTKLECSKINEFLNGKLSNMPRDVIQGIDLLLKANPSGFTFVPVNGTGGQPERRFQQSLKYTEQGLALSMDYLSLFPEPLPIIDFLKEKVDGFQSFLSDEEAKELSQELRKEVDNKLKYLQCKATHCTTKSFTIKGLSKEITRDITVQLKKTKIGLAEYYENKYKKIIDLRLPCLDVDLGGKRRDYLPMEVVAKLMFENSRAKPNERKEKIYERMQSEIFRGPFLGKFGLEVGSSMMKVGGHIIGAPFMKHKASSLNNIHVVKGVRIEKWAFVVFRNPEGNMLNEIEEDTYVSRLKTGCNNLGIGLKEPLVKRTFDVQVLSNVSKVEKMLRDVVKSVEAQLQIIICVMPEKHEGYKYIKWVSETKMGVITQCCLVAGAKKGELYFFKSLALKINAKLGGINFELITPFEDFKKEDDVMLVGASVSHPEAPSKYSTSIAAVAANIDRSMARYVARVEPQYLRKEKILDFGPMVKELVDAYKSENEAKPKKIIIFRQGVSESQIDMVLNKELPNLKSAISDGGMYTPSITLVVAVKRHRTRLFIDGENDENLNLAENVPPGTVVDTKILQPNQWSFYLCSHRGLSGTSRPTYYRVLYDENDLTSKQIQELIYNICYTWAKCTNPVSLVPPLYYAHLAASRGQAFREALPEDDIQGVQSYYTLESKLKNSMFFV